MPEPRLIIITSPDWAGPTRLVIMAAEVRGWDVIETDARAWPTVDASFAGFAPVNGWHQCEGLREEDLATGEVVMVACGPKAALAAEGLRRRGLRVVVAGLTLAPSGNLGDTLDALYDAMLGGKWVAGATLLSTGGGLVLTAERGVRPVVLGADVAGALLDVLDSRVGQRWHRTELRVAPLPNSIGADLEVTTAATRMWAEWGLFPAYQPGNGRYPGAEFGFVAKRTEAGVLITARGSSKQGAAEDCFALVEGIDPDGTLRVSSTGRKASLNAPLAWRIFAARPEIGWIVHLHAFLLGGEAPAVTAPGAEADWDAIAPLIADGADVVNQPMHGCLVLLREPEELLEVLLSANLYRHRSALYDAAYARFQGTADEPTFFERAVAALPIDRTCARVLDLCCGTGASALALRAMGFADIALADGSPTMLAVAEERLGRTGVIAALTNLLPIPDSAFDLITLRQAFNYIPRDRLQDFAREIAGKLAPGGRFVFNTFGLLPAGAGPARRHVIDRPGLMVRTEEANSVTDEEVLHTQRTEIIDVGAEKWETFVDVNRFFQHTCGAIETALLAAGLAVAIQTEGRSLAFVATAPSGAAGADE